MAVADRRQLGQQFGVDVSAGKLFTKVVDVSGEFEQGLRMS